LKAKVKRQKVKDRPKALLIKVVSAYLLPFAFLLLPSPLGLPFAFPRRYTRAPNFRRSFRHEPNSTTFRDDETL
jgi:hypothetical protein